MANIEMNVLKVGDSEFEIADAQARQDCSNLKEDFHEYHSELGAGYADQIVSSNENTDQTPYNFRAVPYDATLEKVEGIVGVDVVLNQLVQNKSTASQKGVTFTNNGNGTYTVNGTASSDAYFVLTDNLVKQHTYLISVNGAVNTAILHIGYENTLTRSAKIITANGTNAIGFRVNNGDTADSEVVTPQVFDLTAMFGTQIADYAYSLEQSTAGAGVAWLKEHFPKIFNAGYVPYNAGTMVHVSGLSAKKTVGFNQWDEEWENGFINDAGQNSALATALRAKNYISVIPNTAYFVCCPRNVFVFYYGENKNFITKDTTHGSGGNLRNEAFTIPQNVHYMRFTMYDTPTYNHDICINLSDPAKNGTYEPYEAHEYPLDSTIDLHGILKLDANNQLYADGDVYGADGTVNHRYGIVDLGMLNWTRNQSSVSGNYYYVGPAISDMKKQGDNYSLWNNMIISCGYSKVASATIAIGTASDKTYGGYDLGTIRIKDDSYTDATTFKSAMSGVYLVYELATPTTETAEPYTATQICDPNGTEEYVTTGIVPVGHNTKYPDNLRKKLDDLPWNFATLIAPTESTYKATRNYTTGSLFIVNNVLYKATANIANGGTITLNTNCTATTLAEVISALS